MSSLMSRGGRVALALALWLPACRRDRAREVELSVVDDHGEALAEVPVHVDGQLLGRSGADGKLTAPFAQLAPGGSLTAECPEAYRPARAVALSQSELPRSLQFVCRPRLRTLAVVVYAPALPGALLRADTQALGRVADDGTLHAVMRRPPGAKFELTLEGQARWRRKVAVRDRDEIILLDAQP